MWSYWMDCHFDSSQIAALPKLLIVSVIMPFLIKEGSQNEVKKASLPQKPGTSY